jgi:hypothetical protein
MKWAPNKKLHFEVAIIRAIQTLGQATLDEVIQKLGELRGGGSARPPSAESVEPVAGDVERGRTEESATRTAVNAGGYSQARVEEKAVPVNAKEIWKQLMTKIPTPKAFLRNSAAAAHVLGIEGRNFKLGFAPDDKAMMDILGTQTNRKFLETLLHEITGKDWSVRLIVDEELTSSGAIVPERSRSENFKDDPLIQEAIQLFKAEIKS